MSRTDILRQMIYEAPYEICIDRARYYTESYKETEGLHPAIRAAKALKKTLENMNIYILDQEQIVGNRTSKLVAISIPVEHGDISQICKLELQAIKKRKIKPFRISPADESLLLKEILPYWKGKSVVDKKRELYKQNGRYISVDWGLRQWIKRYRQFGSDWVKTFFDLLVKGRLSKINESNEGLCTNNPNLVNNVFDVQGHLVLGNKTVVHEGYGGLKEKIVKRLAEVNESLHSMDDGGISSRGPSWQSTTNESMVVENIGQYFAEKYVKGIVSANNRAFLEASLICVDAASNFIRRFEGLAEEKARLASEPQQKEKFEAIREICQHIADRKPGTFREALQLAWFNQVISTISSGMPAVLAMGRPDQFLYPFYQADMDADVITEGEARELLEELLIKCSYNIIMLPSYGKATGSEIGADNMAVTVGGITPDGEDATNALSYLFMDAIENIRSMTNSFSIRISPATNPPEWIDKAMEVFYKARGGPAVFNDDVIIPAMQETGVSLEDARDYAIIGCVEPTSQGNTFATTSGNDISLVGLLEMVFTNGMIRNVGKQHGQITGDPGKFSSYDELRQAYRQQMKFMIDFIAGCVDIKDYVYANEFPNPFISLALDGCIENAMDMTQGGAKYNFASITGRGLGTAADSLAALKKAVFDEKWASITDISDALNTNFKKNKQLQVKLRNKAPKFGNDDNYVDSIARDIAGDFCAEVASHSCVRGGLGGTYRPGFFSYGMFIIDGFFLGATPDGRNAGQPVSNSLSPSINVEKRGPTAVCKSVTKIDHSKINDGMALNMRLLPNLVDTPEKRKKLTALVETYFKLGGMSVQFNIVNQADLLDAQVHPENHQDLVVRVSGYSAYFTDLGKPVQDDIIARYQFNACG